MNRRNGEKRPGAASHVEMRMLIGLGLSAITDTGACTSVGLEINSTTAPVNIWFRLATSILDSIMYLRPTIMLMWHLINEER
jgi:hypothetical protein